MPASSIQHLYVILDGEQMGPLSEQQVLEMLQEGRLQRDTSAWKEGLADWKRLDQILSLSQPLTTPTPVQIQGQSVKARDPWRWVGFGIIAIWALVAMVSIDLALDYFGRMLGISSFCLMFSYCVPMGSERREYLELLYTLARTALICLVPVLIIAFQLFLFGGICWLALKFFKWVLSLF